MTHTASWKTRGHRHRDTLSIAARWRLGQRYARIKNPRLRNARPKRKMTLKENLWDAAKWLGGMALFIIFVNFTYPHVKSAYLLWSGFEERTLSGHAWSDDGTLQIYADVGGEIVDRISYARWLEAQQTPIEVLGLCASACTFYLHNTKVCAAPGSLWMFHKAKMTNDAPEIMKHIGLFSIKLFEQRLPNKELNAWTSAVERQMAPDDELWITGADLIAAGWLTACETEGFSLEKTRPEAVRLSKGFVPDTPLPHK